MPKIVFVEEQSEYGRPFKLAGWEVYTVYNHDNSYMESVKDLIERSFTPNLILFTGGADVSPAIYNEVAHYRTQSSPMRDERCLELWMWARQCHVPCTGICRGGQFLNVVNGGSMHQHVHGHGIWGTHEATDVHTGAVVQVTSTHHQMMIPGDNGEVITTAHEWGAEDIEGVYYPNTSSLCIQFHPEYMDEDSDGFQYYQSLIRDYYG